MPLYKAITAETLTPEEIQQCKFLQAGHLVKYDYCRGTGYSGVAEARGRYGLEYWLKTIQGTNHFNGMKNFIVAECSPGNMFSPLTNAELAMLNAHKEIPLGDDS